MAIERKTLQNGVVVGFDTKRNCYCELPKDSYTEPATQSAGLGMDYEMYTVAQLVALADTEKIDLGDATRKAEIIDKIKAHKALRTY